MAICDLLDDIYFDGDYTLWEVVEEVRLLKARILRSRGEKNDAALIIENIMIHEHPDLWMNQKKCIPLYEENAETAKTYSSKVGEYGWKIMKYRILIMFNELPSFPIDKIATEKEILSLGDELRGML